MGISLPGGIAASLIDPGRQIVAAMGDGGFMMNSQELETAKRLGVAFTVIIFNDNDYGLISWKQSMSRGRSVSTRIDESGGDGPRQRDTHARQAVADNTAVRAAGREVPGDPHLVATHITDQQTIVVEYLPDDVQRTGDRKRVTVFDYANGTIAIRYEGQDLPYSIYDKAGLDLARPFGQRITLTCPL